MKMLRKLNTFSFLLIFAALSGPVVPCHCKYFSKQKEQKSSFTCIGNLPDPKEFSYKDTAQSIFLFVFLVFMVNVFLNRTVSNFFYDYNE